MATTFIHLLVLFISLLAFPALADENIISINSGNTAWLLTSSALVMLMTPGLAFFYGGLVRSKHVVSTVLQNFIALAVVGLLWVIIGHSLVFTENNGWIGSTQAFFLNGFTQQVESISQAPMLAFVAFQMMFAIITPALITGAIAERVRFTPFLFILILWSLLVYVPVAHWVWGPKGWIMDLGAIDFAGGMVVHITAGFSALVAAIMYGRRHDKPKELSPHNVPMVVLGAALLWFGWFGFNAGSALTSGALAAHAFVTTFVGACSALLAWMIVDWLKDGKPTAVGASIGAIVGLVCITPGAGFVTIKAAFGMTLFAGAFCNFVARFLKRFAHIDDTLDVFACHGVGGFMGAILTGMLATKSVNSGLALEGLWAGGTSKLLIANLTGCIAVAVYSMVVTFIVIKTVGLFTTIRASASEQTKGLDEAMHGEKVSK